MVKDELGNMKQRWDSLNYFISERAQALADILAKLGDFNENARDLENGLKRAEDKLRTTNCGHYLTIIKQELSLFVYLYLFMLTQHYK